MPEPAPSPLATIYTARGIELGEYHGALVPRRFSDAVKEHQAVRQSAGVFDFSFRARFALKGDDRIKFLHRVVSNDIKKLLPGQGTYATLLNAQGHILVDFRVYCAEDRLVIDTDCDLRDKAMQSIGRYIIGDRVQIERDERGAIAVQGPGARRFLEREVHLAQPLAQEYDHVSASLGGNPVTVVRATNTGEEGFEIWADAAALPAIWNSLCAGGATEGPTPCGTEALESLRIEAGIPRYGADLGEDTLPLEPGLLNALSFNKGCYIGQEIVERARSRGHVNWKLCGLIVDGSAVPPPGEEIISAGKETGEITSACASPTLGKTIALAYLRREVAEPGTPLALASGAAVTVTALPFYSPASPRG